MNKWTNEKNKKINKNKIKFCDFKTPTWAPFSPGGPSLPGWPCKTKQRHHNMVKTCKTIELSECFDLMCVTELRDATVYDVEATSQKRTPAFLSEFILRSISSFCVVLQTHGKPTKELLFQSKAEL